MQSLSRGISAILQSSLILENIRRMFFFFFVKIYVHVPVVQIDSKNILRIF